VNAIDALVEAMNALRKSSSGSQGWSVNVGMIGGGTQANVIPDSAWAEVDVRAWSAPAMRAAAAALTALAEERELLEIDILDERPVMGRSELSAVLFGRAREVAGAAGIALEEGASGGGSDGNFVAALGTPVLDGLGPDGGGAHALDVHILVPSLIGARRPYGPPDCGALIRPSFWWHQTVDS
jgi:glutamate carboxypeptidase